MKKYLISLLCVCAVVNEMGTADSSLITWREFKLQHGKLYGPEEDGERFANFLANKRLIERHNANSSAGYKMGLNHMSDWSREEFERLTVSKNSVAKIRSTSSLDHAHLSSKLVKPLEPEVPDEVDWRKVPNRVSAVKELGHCASSWAFATTGLFEGQQANLNISKLIPLSEQQLVDCSKRNRGCEGGVMIDAINDLMEHGGIESEQDYKYEGVKGMCRADESKSLMKPKGGHWITLYDEIDLRNTVANYGPVGVTLDATENLKNYHSGILDDPDCNPDHANYDGLAVGYGKDEKGLHYWIVKNSWGPNWGEGGYFRIRRGVNMCGIAEGATTADF